MSWIGVVVTWNRLHAINRRIDLALDRGDRTDFALSCHLRSVHLLRLRRLANGADVAELSGDHDWPEHIGAWGGAT